MFRPMILKPFLEWVFCNESKFFRIALSSFGTAKSLAGHTP